MYHSFERIVSDVMLSCEAYNHMPDDNDLELDYIPGYDDGEYDDIDDTYADDMQGEEDFA